MTGLIFMNQNNIRNFCIIAHIDHGKSTLADRMLEITGSVLKVERKQLLDSMDLEQERGITIKLKAIRMNYVVDGESFEFNLIDTPGHVDFGYEVSRALKSAEGALLLVDATQGVQAQTLANLDKARETGLSIIPVLNKIDLESAQIEETMIQLLDLGFTEDQIMLVSAKTGQGVKELLDKIPLLIPSPYENEKSRHRYGDMNDDFSRALVFDSFYDEYRGVVAFVRVVNGSFSKNQEIKFVAGNSITNIIDMGYLTPKEVKTNQLGNGEVGFIATGLKSITQVRVGDTITLKNQKVNLIPGYKEPIPVVFLSFYPLDSSEYLDLREGMEKLNLSDAAFTFKPESIGSIGKGFRCGFLGLLHADIIRERIEREFGIEVITTTPSVRYLIETTKGEEIEIMSASEFPDTTYIKLIKEPWAKLSVFTSVDYMSQVMDLCKSRRAIYKDMLYIDDKRIRINYEIPLIELIIDFFDKLKSVSSGFASIDYEIIDYRHANLVKLDILVAGDLIPPLSLLVQKQSSVEEGKRVIAKLKDLIPRQQFKVSLQAAISEKIIAREDIPPVRKDVTGYLYGGDITRKMKLLEKQKKGKKRMKRFGKVDIPQDVFWKIMER